MGYNFQEASSLSLFLIMVTGFSAFTQFQKAKLVELQLAIVVFIGGQIGSRISVNPPEKKVKKVLAFVFFILAIYMIVKPVL